MSFIFSGCIGRQPVTPKKHAKGTKSMYEVRENRADYFPLPTPSTTRKYNEHEFNRGDLDISVDSSRIHNRPTALQSYLYSQLEPSGQRSPQNDLSLFERRDGIYKENSVLNIASRGGYPNRSALQRGPILTNWQKQEASVGVQNETPRKVNFPANVKPVSRINYREINHELPVFYGQPMSQRAPLYDERCNHDTSIDETNPSQHLLHEIYNSKSRQSSPLKHFGQPTDNKGLRSPISNEHGHTGNFMSSIYHGSQAASNNKPMEGQHDHSDQKANPCLTRKVRLGEKTPVLPLAVGMCTTAQDNYRTKEALRSSLCTPAPQPENLLSSQYSPSRAHLANAQTIVSKPNITFSPSRSLYSSPISKPFLDHRHSSQSIITKPQADSLETIYSPYNGLGGRERGGGGGDDAQIHTPTHAHTHSHGHLYPLPNRLNSFECNLPDNVVVKVSDRVSRDSRLS